MSGVRQSRTFSYSIFVRQSYLLSLTLCQALMVASLTPQTHSPPIIAPPEFIVCVTCRPSFTTALVRVSKAFNTGVLLYCPRPSPLLNSHRDTWWYEDTSGWQYLTWRCSFFHPPSFQRHLLTLPSLPRPNLLSNRPGSTHSVYVLRRCAHSHLTFKARLKERKEVKSVFLRETGIVLEYNFYVFSDSMEYCFLKGFLVVLLIQHCTSEGRVALCK